VTESFWQRYANARMTRRRALQAMGGIAVSAGAMVVAGCGDSNGSIGQNTATAGRSDEPDILNPLNPPVPGGTYITANSANFGSWDPHTGIQVASAYFPRMYNLLLSQSPTKPEFVYLDLAESYEIPDDLTYVFNLRPGVRIAPNAIGVPERDIDGEDVRVTFERIKADPLANQYSFASKYVDRVTVNGDSVAITTAEPYAWFLPRMSAYNNTVPPRELVTEPGRFTDVGVGGGPYSLVSVTENDVARFTRNTNFYGRDARNNNHPLPYIDELEVRVIFDRLPQQTAFGDGQIHQYWAETGEEASLYDGYPVSRDPVFAFIAFTMNPRKEPFTDPRVRRAISRAINRQQYIDLIYGGDARPNGLVHWPLGTYALSDEDLASTYQPFNLDEARSLVEEVGGIRFKMMYPANTTIQEHGQHLSIFTQQMREANIQVEEVPLEFSNWITGYQKIDYDSSLALNQIYETPELPLLFHTTGGPFSDRTYIQGLGDPEIDAAVAKANVLLDAEERLTAVHDAQKLIYSKDPAFLPLVGPYLHMVYSKRLHNIPSGVGTTFYSLSDYWLAS
jgi:peptide/nickel transport system substrate-binding protein